MIEVVDWVSWDKADEMPRKVGGLGGFFKDGMRWKDYSNQFTDEANEYNEAIRKSVIERKIKATGIQHQSGDDLCPVFNDGTSAQYSYRAWGDLLAAIWSEEENKDYHYMDFYC